MVEVGDFVWLGIEKEGGSFGGNSPGSVDGFEETLFDVSSAPDDWEPTGDPVGAAHCYFVRTPQGTGITTLILEFDDGSTLVASGSLPIDGSTIGGGDLTVVGGTGRYGTPLPRLRVEHMNPHKYSPVV